MNYLSTGFWFQGFHWHSQHALPSRRRNPWKDTASEEGDKGRNGCDEVDCEGAETERGAPALLQTDSSEAHRGPIVLQRRANLERPRGQLAPTGIASW